MTKEEIARALLEMIKEDAKRPPREQLQPLIDAGVIDEQGQVLVGGDRPVQEPGATNEQGGVRTPRKKAKAKKRRTA
jgi:hypothetical protein